LNIQDILASESLIDEISDKQLDEIGTKIGSWFEEDCHSRREWEKKYESWVKLASLTMETKTRPWAGAANIKYPLLTQAAIQFNARVVPALTPNSEPVGVKAIGDDPDGQRYAGAVQVGRHMNYQLMTEIEEWEEDFDRLSLVLAITGQEYKKTYFSYEKSRIVSEYVSAADLVLHYWYKDFAKTRKTQKVTLTWNELVEKMNLGLYKDYKKEDLGEPDYNQDSVDSLRQASDVRHGYNPSQRDEATTDLVLEHHGWLDLDDDGYEEPYRIVVHHRSKKVLAIEPRFTEENLSLGEKEEVLMIEPIEYYTKFDMIPNPDGSQYSIGFGTLIAPINNTVNTTINQLLDAGTLSTMQSGFIGKGVRLRNGVFSVAPGKWPIVNSTGGDLKNNIVPLPIKEPSSVLLSLLNYMVQAGKELSATTDIFAGQHPGQNAKAGVTATVKEEGLKVFNAVYKRIRRSMKREMHKIFALNKLLLDNPQGSKTERSAALFGVTAEHYNVDQNALEPSADPTIAIKEQRIQKNMTALQLGGQYGSINMQEALRRVLADMEVTNLELLMQEQPQPPDPKVEMENAKLQLENAKLQIQAAEIERKQNKDDADILAKKVDQSIELIKAQQADEDRDEASSQQLLSIVKDLEKIQTDARIKSIPNSRPPQQGEL